MNVRRYKFSNQWRCERINGFVKLLQMFLMKIFCWLCAHVKCLQLLMLMNVWFLQVKMLPKMYGLVITSCIHLKYCPFISSLILQKINIMLKLINVCFILSYISSSSKRRKYIISIKCWVTEFDIDFLVS